jgi:broad specificity phosphatase PhoE
VSVEVVFETHATTDDNEAGIATGWLPGRLSAAGRDQSRELGERRRDDGLAIVFTSDLRRAVERVAGFLAELLRSRDGERVVVIGHGATRLAFEVVANGRPTRGARRRSVRVAAGLGVRAFRCLGGEGRLSGAAPHHHRSRRGRG